ncbi:hypothetical protein CKM354_000731300 [Cercospora kikuchii]|uniref:Uncharacterized protein n=1 Tax=Cercospora kikuchii TaxID=84275 RepID=A0A9P3CJQ7_9PEZI|nr:uncharacterized protein CKM354_000731300 [Cercospora kikuchii]GIZ44104.1 hypothetical protein CKM354_000731300 [Cercospora kikuchii]
MGNLDNHPTIDAHLVCHLTTRSRSLVAFNSLKGLRAHYNKIHKDKQRSLSQEEVEAKSDEALQKHIYAKPQSLSPTPSLAPLSSFDRNIALTNNPSAEKRRRRRAPLKQVDPQGFAEMNATLTKAHRTWRQRKLSLDEDQAVVQQSGSQSSCDDQEYSEFEGCSD